MIATTGNLSLGVHREKIGDITLNGIRPGTWRMLTNTELEHLWTAKPLSACSDKFLIPKVVTPKARRFPKADPLDTGMPDRSKPLPPPPKEEEQSTKPVTSELPSNKKSRRKLKRLAKQYQSKLEAGQINIDPDLDLSKVKNFSKLRAPEEFSAANLPKLQVQAAEALERGEKRAAKRAEYKAEREKKKSDKNATSRDGKKKFSQKDYKKLSRSERNKIKHKKTPETKAAKPKLPTNEPELY